MKALQLEQPKSWKLIDIPEPPPPKADEALLRIHRVGVCGTDIAGYLGKFPFFSYPRIPGHELGAEVVAVGSSVTNVKVGDRCSVEPYMNCGKCYSCIRGHTNCCEYNQTLGVMCDGGLTDYFVIPSRKLHVANNLSYEQAALVETLAIGCHAVDRAKVTKDDTVLIIGAGPIGLSVLEFVKIAKAFPIVADLSEKRLQFVADKMGVTATIKIEGNDGDVEQLEKLTQGRRADVVIDATGNHRSMSNAVNMAAFAGRVAFVGITQQNFDFPHAPAMHRRELTLLASRNALPGDFKRIIGHIEQGHIDTTLWVTHHADFTQVPTAFDNWTNPDSGVLKAMIHVT